MKKFMALALALIMMMSFALAEETDAVVATVNGEAITQSALDAQKEYYVSLFTSYGMDTTDESVAAYLEDMALTMLIEDLLLVQDMTEKGVYDFTEEELTQINTDAVNAYSQMVVELGEYLLSNYGTSDEDMTDENIVTYGEYAASMYGYTLDYYLEYCQNDAASQKYADLLMEGATITEEEVQAEYQARVEESKTLYAQDIEAFETALTNNGEIWYRPEGYRSVLQIMLATDEEDKLAATQQTVEEIYTKLENGASFEELIREYGMDASFQDEAFFTTGYMVHKESVMWEESFVAAAFSADMAQPGCYTKEPVISSSGVHILFYLKDMEAGAVELTDEVKAALTDSMYDTLADEKVVARVEELAAAAKIVIMENE